MVASLATKNGNIGETESFFLPKLFRTGRIFSFWRISRKKTLENSNLQDHEDWLYT